MAGRSARVRVQDAAQRPQAASTAAGCAPQANENGVKTPRTADVAGGSHDPPTVLASGPLGDGRWQLALELPAWAVKRLSPNGRAQSHWPRTHARTWIMDYTDYVAKAARLPRFDRPVRVIFRWVVPTRARRDIDNLAGNGCIKGVLDALVKGGHLADDSSEHVVGVATELEYQKGRRCVVVLIEEAER